jgi:hypothetical protein
MTKPTITPSSQPAAGGGVKRLWRVRTDKGDIFGPADIDTLKLWARDGRLAPTNEISDDGQVWTPVTSMHELEMDWVAEVTSGSFYGPIHRDALAELLREGSVSSAAPVFRRSNPHARSVSEREQALEASLQEARQQLHARVTDLETRLSAARAQLDERHAEVSARDLEFDAERQEQRASLARLQAELLKRDGRIAALEKEQQRLEAAVRDREAIESRLSEAERHASENARRHEQAAEQLEQARALQREAERAVAGLRERVSAHDRDTEALRESVRTLKLRVDSARKLMQQAVSAIGGTEKTTDAELVDVPPPEGGVAKEGPPPLASPAGGIKPGMSLADLEAQAQRELRQLGNKGGTIFKGRPKG